jgi:hypothetical protein
MKKATKSTSLMPVQRAGLSQRNLPPAAYNGMNNFVAPPRQDVYDIQQVNGIPTSPVGYTLTTNQTSELDRAHAFVTVTFPASLAVGVVALLIGILGFRVPFLSIPALLILIFGMSLVWFAAWFIYLWFSPVGMSFFHLRKSWQEREREQNFIHRRYERED